MRCQNDVTYDANRREHYRGRDRGGCDVRSIEEEATQDAKTPSIFPLAAVRDANSHLTGLLRSVVCLLANALDERKQPVWRTSHNHSTWLAPGIVLTVLTAFEAWLNELIGAARCC